MAENQSLKLELNSSNDGRLKHIPTRVTIETVFGCNASCTMCVIDNPTERKKGVMTLEMSNKIMDRLAPYKDVIKQMDLFALGEPMLDPFIFERIRYAKRIGFQSVAISTNADLLFPDRQKKLLDSGIDTVIFSIDGIKKETHEGIRKKLKFDRVVANCLSTIKLRDEGDYKVKIVIRFIRQECNRDEWEPFKAFWLPKITKEKGDLIAMYDMHTWGGDLTTKEQILGAMHLERDPAVEAKPCQHYLNTLVILADGTIPLCHEDILGAEFNFGNVNDHSPIEIFNNDMRNKYRNIQLSGNKNLNRKCEQCTVHYSEPLREFV